MRLRCGSGRVVARARQGIGGQAIDTDFRHDLSQRQRCLPASAVDDIAVRVVASAVLAPLMTRLRFAVCVSTAAVEAVDPAVVVGLADVEDHRAARAANPHQHLDIIHARTQTAALMKVDSPVRLRATSPGQRPRATRRLRDLTPGPSVFAVERIPYETPSPVATSRPARRCSDFSGSRRSLTGAGIAGDRRGWGCSWVRQRARNPLPGGGCDTGCDTSGGSRGPTG
jgi:hypothetical protein